MFRIIEIKSLLRYVALTSVALSVVIFALLQSYFFPNFSLFRIVTISSIVTSGLIMLLLSTFVSRKLWAGLRKINGGIYPDLNGTWEGVVTLEDGKEIVTRAVIRQSLSGTQIDMHGETIKSTTVETTPAIEQGQKKLHYVYRANPKNPAWGSYMGTTLFDIRVVDAEGGEVCELSGFYYTDRKTRGRIRLKQTSGELNCDVSYY